MYILNSISAQSWASTPPAPALTVNTAEWLSNSLEYKDSSSRSTIFCSTSSNWGFISSNSEGLSLLNSINSSRSFISLSKIFNKFITFSIFEALLTIFCALGFFDQKFSLEIILLRFKSSSFLLSKSKILLGRRKPFLK